MTFFHKIQNNVYQELMKDGLYIFFKLRLPM